MRFVYKLLLLPLVAGIAYEVIRFAGSRKDSVLMRIILAPGLLMQKITTKEPEPDMIEVAIKSLQSVLERKPPTRRAGRRKHRNAGYFGRMRSAQQSCSRSSPKSKQIHGTGRAPVRSGYRERSGASFSRSRKPTRISPKLWINGESISASGSRSARSSSFWVNPSMKICGTGSNRVGGFHGTNFPVSRPSSRLCCFPRTLTTTRMLWWKSARARAATRHACSPATCSRMYIRYAERKGWQSELMSATESGIGGYSRAVLAIKGKGAYSRLKFEGGVHRVQRVPATESSGRLHTRRPR